MPRGVREEYVALSEQATVRRMIEEVWNGDDPDAPPTSSWRKTWSTTRPSPSTGTVSREQSIQADGCALPSPTGKRFSVDHVHWFRLADGKVVEYWNVRDDPGHMT
jgi:ketosteroid isomerase-like protein